jgi:hypothetical protein
VWFLSREGPPSFDNSTEIAVLQEETILLYGNDKEDVRFLRRWAEAVNINFQIDFRAHIHTFDGICLSPDDLKGFAFCPELQKQLSALNTWKRESPADTPYFITFRRT